MKNFLLVFLFLIAAASSQVIITDEEKAWVMFQERYNQSYSTPEEVMLRKGFFMKNYKDIVEHNKENSINGTGFIMNMNHFTDRSREELLKIITCGQMHTPDWPLKKSDLNTKTPNLKHAPEVDWVKKRRVSAVKDQKECCASYAFATLGQLESALSVQIRLEPLNFSAQEIVDCAGKPFHDACRGGVLSITIKYGLEKGVHLWETYPYTGCRGPCHKYVPGPHFKTKQEGFLMQATDLAIMYAVMRQPITAYIDATPQFFIYYSNGIYSDVQCNQTKGNHYVLLVGYGVDPMYSTPYWKIKNSWGEDWGEDGYMRMARGSNTCGIRNSLYIDLKMV